MKNIKKILVALLCVATVLVAKKGAEEWTI